MLRWILPFGLRREQPMSRRPKETVKLLLEELKERILPSATPEPQMAEETMRMVATMMQERVQLFETVEQNLVNIFDTYTQRIAQDVSSAVQRWEQLTGITPAPSGSGSGSGSGTITPTHNPSHQETQPAALKSGRGTGSGGITSHENSNKQRIMPLDEPGSGSGGSGGSLQFGSTDTLEWDPAGSGVIPWIDLSKGDKRLSGPTPTNPVIFDGGVSNTPITWAASVASITLQKGYNAKMTIPAQQALYDNGTISMDDSSTLYVYFGDGSQFQIEGGGYITNMTLTGIPTGELDLLGGTTTIAAKSSYTENIGVSLYVFPTATLQDNGYTTLTFTNDQVQLNIAGAVNVFYGNGAANTLIESSAYKDNYINVTDGGTLTYLGSGNVADTFTMPIVIQDGTFILCSAGNAPNGGTLTVKGANSNTNGKSVYMKTPPNASVQLFQGATLVADSGYYQAGGTLETMDGTTCTLQDNSGNTTIAGGTVWIDNPGSGTYGELVVNTTTLNFGGTLNVSILGYIPGETQGNQDKLIVSGKFMFNPQASTGLYINIYGTMVSGDTWIIIYSGGAITSNTDTINFAALTSQPIGGINCMVYAKNDSQYILSY